MANKKRTTLKDIANELNISSAAVSKAMHNDSRISDKTKNEVKRVAKKLNYQPNHLASALRKGKSNLVGVIVPRTNSNFFSSVVEHMEAVLNKAGYNIIITQSNESFEKECKTRNVSFEVIPDAAFAKIQREIANPEVNQDVIKLEVAPPGQAANIIIPIAISGFSDSTDANRKPTSGKIISWFAKPTKIALG